MSVSLAYLERCAAETGYTIATLEKVTRLGELAAEIARHPLLGGALALKGGTALNLCVGDAPTRMSVDLDYNYIGRAERARMLADRPQVEAALARLAEQLGYRLQWSAAAAAGRKMYATYRSVLGPEGRIEVDLNYLFRVSLGRVSEAVMWQPGALDRPRVRLVSLLELAVGKLLALLDRVAPRDAWDAARLPAITGDLPQTGRFRAVFIALSVTLAHPVSTYSLERMRQRLTPQILETQLIPMLATVELPKAAALVDQAWRVVAPLVELTTAEAEFVDRVAGGELRPEILFPDDHEMATIVATHPAIQWKLENVRRHRGRESDR